MTKFTFSLILLFPIFLITGNFLVNFFYISISILSILNFNKKDDFFRSNIFYLLVFFLIYLSINLLFSINFLNSYPRVIKFLLIILFIKEIFCFNDKKEIYFEKIIKFWIILYIIVTIDIVFELIFGFNTLGFRSYLEGRIASFFGDELVVGTFYHFFSLIILSYFVKNKYPNLLVISLIIAMIVGWVVHYVSHNYDFTMLYEEISPSFIKQRFPRIHKYIKIVLRYTMDFHDHVHHDTSINKSPLNLSMEMFQNFLTQGFILVLISYLLNLGLQIRSTVYKLNHLVVLLWALFYTTIHNINYNLMKNEIHEEHHVNEYTNYGIDLVDILFNTKYDLENIESHNHGAINVSFITLVLFYSYKWVNREEIPSKWHVTKWLSRVL